MVYSAGKLWLFNSVDISVCVGSASGKSSSLLPKMYPNWQTNLLMCYAFPQRFSCFMFHTLYTWIKSSYTHHSKLNGLLTNVSICSISVRTVHHKSNTICAIAEPWFVKYTLPSNYWYIWKKNLWTVVIVVQLLSLLQISFTKSK